MDDNDYTTFEFGKFKVTFSSGDGDGVDVTQDVDMDGFMASLNKIPESITTLSDDDLADIIAGIIDTEIHTSFTIDVPSDDFMNALNGIIYRAMLESDPLFMARPVLLRFSES